MSPQSPDTYYVPHGSAWPIVGSFALFFMAVGFANYLNGMQSGMYVLLFGTLLLLIMMVGWFGAVIREGQAGLYNEQVEKSFRWGMIWFIFSEVMFFAVFFGALFYARVLSIPWLGGAAPEASTQEFLWPLFDAHWPLLNPPGTEHSITGTEFDIPSSTIGAFGLPALNTAILLASAVTLTWGHVDLKNDNRQGFIRNLALTIFLGFIFVGLQIYEYGHAIYEYNLTLQSGIYGSIFYMLTGFHGFHVTLGACILLVMLLRAMRGHFTAKSHFAFEASAWYWHFVDYVWLVVFVFVYFL